MRREEQEEHIASLLSGLDKAEAPVGFESRVMRRISKSERPETAGRPVLLLVLKFAAPAAMLLLVGVFFVFFGDREVNVSLVPPVQEAVQQPVPIGDPGAHNGAVAVSLPNNDPGNRSPVINQSRKANSPASPSPGINSEDFAVKPPGETYLPPGLDPRPQNADRSTISPGRGGVPIGEVLGMVGIGSNCSDDGCRVTSVSKGGLAERAKLLPGDLIISIDGRRIDGSMAFSGTTPFKSFQVVRAGRTVTLSLSVN